LRESSSSTCRGFLSDLGPIKEKSDSITAKAITNDPNQKKPIDVKLKGED
jgi:hypothetical protein